jgi:hypothetical protein
MILLKKNVVYDGNIYANSNTTYIGLLFNFGFVPITDMSLPDDQHRSKHAAITCKQNIRDFRLPPPCRSNLRFSGIPLNTAQYSRRGEISANEQLQSTVVPSEEKG